MLKARKRFFRGFPVYQPPQPFTGLELGLSGAVALRVALDDERERRRSAQQLAPLPLAKPYSQRTEQNGTAPGGKGAASPLVDGRSTSCPPSDADMGQPAPRPDAGGVAAREGAGRGANSLIHEGIEGNPRQCLLSGEADHGKT